MLAARISRTQRLLKQASKAKKRARIEDLLQEAESSAHSSTIFSVVRRLAPKSRAMRIQLRDKTGRLLIGQEEADYIASYLRQVFGSTDKLGPPNCEPVTGLT